MRGMICGEDYRIFSGCSFRSQTRGNCVSPPRFAWAPPFPVPSRSTPKKFYNLVTSVKFLFSSLQGRPIKRPRIGVDFFYSFYSMSRKAVVSICRIEARWSRRALGMGGPAQSAGGKRSFPAFVTAGTTSPQSGKSCPGFSLMEVVFALAILGILMGGILSFYSASQARLRQADRVTIATMVARNAIAETVLDLEKRVAEGKFPESDEEKDEPCPEPYEAYECHVQIRKIELPMPPGGAGGGEGAAAGGAASGPMQLLMQQLKLDELVREVKVTVKWTVRGREQSVDVTTHMVKL